MMRWQEMTDQLAADRGVALVTVLLLVAVMSVGAVVAFETLGFAIKRTSAARLYDQARLYAVGGEQIARLAGERLADADQTVINALGFDGGSDISYPIDGGVIEGTITDASNCFNVNSLVQLADRGAYVSNPVAFGQFQYLLQLLGSSEGQAETLTAALTDWIDSDTRQTLRGAEDYDYVLNEPPYRTANSFIVDISELALVRGYTAPLRAELAPFLCALPTSAPALLNVNGLQPNHAALLSALVGPSVTLEQMRGLITERPRNGYETVGQFWQTSAFSGKPISQAVRASVDVKPSLFRADIRVRYFEADVHMVSNVWIRGAGKSIVLGRSFGVVS
jgi:general secretion pathway protein K